MGKIFLSYASQDRELARDIQARLRQHGHNVFFDEDKLKPSDGYDKIIQRRIAKSEVMVFLCSRHSLAPGRYTLTELELVQRLWPNPEGRVLPVLIGDSTFEDLPPYLKGLSAYRYQGDPVASITHLAEEMVGARRRRKLLRWGALIGLIGGIGLVIVLIGDSYWRNRGGREGPDAREFFASQIDDMQCAWLGIGQFADGPDGAQIEIFGPAGLPGGSIERDFLKEADDAGISVDQINMRRLTTVERSQCELIDNLRRYRYGGIARVEAESETVEGTRYFKLIYNPDELADNLSIYSIDPGGTIQYAQDRNGLLAQSRPRDDGRNEAYYIATHSGWGGFLVMESDARIEAGVLTLMAEEGRFAEAFDSRAEAGNWQFELVWLNTEN